MEEKAVKIYDKEEVITNGMIKVFLNNKYGLINSDRVELIPTEYEWITYMGLNMFSVKNIIGKWAIWKLYKSKIINIKFEYDNISTYCEGFAIVERKGLFGFIDSDGIEKIKCKYSKALSFKEGLACVFIDYQCGFVNQLGVEVVDCIYDYAAEFNCNLSMVKLNGKYGFVDRNGIVAIPITYSGIGFFDDKGKVSANSDEKSGYINIKGDWV